MRCSPLVPFCLHLWGICLSAWAHDQLLEAWSSYCHTVISSHRNTFSISVYSPVKESWTVDQKSATKTREINGSGSFSHVSVKSPKQKQIYFWVKSLRKIYVLITVVIAFPGQCSFLFIMPLKDETWRDDAMMKWCWGWQEVVLTNQ